MNTQPDHIVANYEAFKSQLPELIAKHPGKFALIKDKVIIEIFDTASDAVKAGRAICQDNPFSVQEITNSPINLGFFSYAMH